MSVLVFSTIFIWAGNYATTADAMLAIYPEGHYQLVMDSWDDVPPAVKQSIREAPGLSQARLEGEFGLFSVADHNGESIGWAVVTEEFGMHQPITFMVGVDPNGMVTGVVLMVFRESRGNGIKHKRFRNQFQGKTLADPLRIKRDLINVSGSTISSRSMARGVKKVLQLLSAGGHVKP